MSRLKILTGLVVILATLNIGLLAFILSKGPVRHQPINERIIKRLQFDEAQSAQYEAIIKESRKELHALEDSKRQYKALLFAEVGSMPELELDSLLKQVSSIQQLIERSHLEHLEDIRSICREDQVLLFDEMRSELLTIFSPRRGRRGRPGPPPPHK